ncbi:D-2-hydroxyacid dehydrogenase [Rhodocytophaga aerolata]|uniref:D-2-hydroxyacid dehydrogenase n=1 Tax=Rhodocytophaga aerolata TaxID=455078 RepID=A0ABT8RI51_9BACT|nr:D-2-hydroxyacid dehydrogenase [Rhodocytophaga aerolata]MDO1450848.1 D-2-hydroxyacid dehydrogenase [Rhodocytophaga aerolata]
MATEPISRRNFITNLSATGALLSLTDTPLVQAYSTFPAASTPQAVVGPIKVISTQKLSEAEIGQIRSAGNNVELLMLADTKEINAHIADAEVILGSVDASLIGQAKKLKWVQVFGAGVENMPMELMEHPCLLTNMQRVYAPVIAESAIGLLLSLTRGLAQESIPAFKERAWLQTTNVALDDLYGKTIGIVGMGGIGTETARRLHYGFNMRVLATDAKPLPKPEFVAELHDPTYLMKMVPQVDVLMSAAPLTKQTKLLFNEQVFSKMKPSAYFINVSRGGLVDQQALVKALKDKRIRGAGLDVTTPEPLPADHPLWACSNLVITPHNSGMAPVRQLRAIALVCENMRRYTNGLPLMNVVDKMKGY